MTDLGLARLRSGQAEPLIGYTSYTDDGKTLKCSSIFIHDENRNPIAGFCINLDVTTLLLVDRFLHTFVTSRRQEPDVTESFSEDLGQMIETMIAECAYQVGKPISLMMKSDRVKVVELLDKRGAFQLRKAVPIVAKCLGVTQKTIYNYLSELEGAEE
jgi:predicted transcriptional regulator YheO